MYGYREIPDPKLCIGLDTSSVVRTHCPAPGGVGFSITTRVELAGRLALPPVEAGKNTRPRRMELALTFCARDIHDVLKGHPVARGRPPSRCGNINLHMWLK